MTPAVEIVAAVIADEAGRLLLVRKRGTSAFMQPGGKREVGESDFEALARELREELGCVPPEDAMHSLGTFEAPAANEPGAIVRAALYAVGLDGAVACGGEIAEVRWIDPSHIDGVPLAPLTRDHVLPLAARDRR